MRAVSLGVVAALIAVAPAGAQKRQDMQVTTWFSLESVPTVLGPGKSLIVAPARSNQEEITVFANRRRKMDAEWRADIAAGVPGYEASGSPAAQRLYAPSPVWASPEQQRLTSEIKDYFNACGLPVPGAQIDCPNLH
jgi:hypothetical protein